MEEIITYDTFSLMRSDHLAKVHPHTHVMYELNYTIEGRVECYQGFNRAKVLAPGYWLSAPGVVHGCNIDMNQPYRRLVLFFDSKLISENMRDQLTRPFIAQELSYADADGGVMNDLLTLERLLHSNVPNKEKMAEMRIEALLVNLYMRIFSVAEAKLDDAPL
ncbi:MAG: AraC family ligand binding domain-containing protein, partial [Clostridia bacterium]|nr:AraC family ligand binding domain-containing protein [Clostridia bacterium]